MTVTFQNDHRCDIVHPLGLVSPVLISELSELKANYVSSALPL